MPIGLELGSAWIFFGITHPEWDIYFRSSGPLSGFLLISSHDK